MDQMDVQHIPGGDGPGTGMSVTDMTPRVTQTPQAHTISEPRIFAFAADTARAAVERQFVLLGGEVDALRKQVVKLEEIIEVGFSERQSTMEIPVMRGVVPALHFPDAPTLELPSHDVSAAPAITALPAMTYPSATTLELPRVDVSAAPAVKPLPEFYNPESLALINPREDPLPKNVPVPLDVHPKPEMLGLQGFSQVISEIEMRRNLNDQGALDMDGSAAGITAGGSPELYKVLCLRGYKKVNDAWVAMSVEEELADPPTLSRAEAEEAKFGYCLQPTWDWVRAKYVPLEEEA